MKKILTSPVTHFNVLVFGFFILVGVIHNHVHYTIEQDADSYVRAWCKKNPETCKRYLSDY